MSRPEPTYVFIDTEAFEKYRLDIGHPVFQKLVALASTGAVTVLMPEVTRAEIEAHIADKVKIALAKLGGFRKKAAILRQAGESDLDSLFVEPSYEDTCQKLIARFGEYLSALGAVEVPVDCVNCSELLGDYFGKNPPFGPGKKKSEFPDAIAAKALLKGKGSLWDGEVLVVSGDPDWQRTCEANHEFIHVERLPALLDQFRDELLVAQIKSGVRADLALVESRIEESFVDRGFSISDVDGEVEAVDISSLELQALYVLDAEDGDALLEGEWHIEFTGDATFVDPDSGVFDKEDNKWLFQEYLGGTVVKSLDVSVQISVAYDKDTPESITLQHVTLELGDVEVDLDDIEDIRG